MRVWISCDGGVVGECVLAEEGSVEGLGEGGEIFVWEGEGRGGGGRVGGEILETEEEGK